MILKCEVRGTASKLCRDWTESVMLPEMPESKGSFFFLLQWAVEMIDNSDFVDGVLKSGVF